jgi:hypothetical protein
VAREAEYAVAAVPPVQRLNRAISSDGLEASSSSRLVAAVDSSIMAAFCWVT